jgi:DNA adenine methylase
MLDTAEEAVRPFLRWAGSKRKLLPELSKHCSVETGRYIEPFMGSACLFFHLKPSAAVLADTNADLIELFEVIRQSPHEVYDRLIRLPRTERQYYELRGRTPHRMKVMNRVVRFLYLNRNCFNGLYRTNLKGQFNVPFSAVRTGDYPSRDEFLSASKLLARASLACGDFSEVVRTHVRPGDLVYLDPPYAVENRRVFRQYGPQTFGTSDLERLATLLRHIDDLGARFVLSYADCPEAIRTFQEWPQRRVVTQRNISGFARHRRKDTELIAMNAPIPPEEVRA